MHSRAPALSKPSNLYLRSVPFYRDLGSSNVIDFFQPPGTWVSRRNHQGNLVRSPGPRSGRAVVSVVLAVFPSNLSSPSLRAHPRAHLTSFCPTYGRRSTVPHLHEILSDVVTTVAVGVQTSLASASAPALTDPGCAESSTVRVCCRCIRVSYCCQPDNSCVIIAVVHTTLYGAVDK